MGDKLTDYYDVHNVLYVLFLLRCYGTLVDTGVDERTTIQKKIVHLGTTYIKWAELQMTDDSEMGLINITGHYMHCFFSFESFNFQFWVNFTQMEQMNSLHVVSKYKFVVYRSYEDCMS